MRVSTGAVSAALILCLSACDMNAPGKGPYTVPGEGLRVEFPTGLKVCRLMSMGYAYTGFSADLGETPASCDATDRSPTASMGIWTDTFPMQSKIDLLCRPDLPAPDLQPKLLELFFAGRKTYGCVYRYPPDRIQLYIFAEGVRPGFNQVNVYVGELLTNDDRLDRDLATFKELIAGAEIEFPAPTKPPSADSGLPRLSPTPPS